MWGRKHFSFLLICGLAIGLEACGKGDRQEPSLESPPGCAPYRLPVGKGASGSAQVFLFDPILSSGNMALSPLFSQLDDFRFPVQLAHLDGQGVLKGSYVKVLNGLKCEMGYGAFDPSHQFNYSHSDFKFQETMAYYYSDLYREKIDQAGYLMPRKPIFVVAHCMLEDNAYYQQGYSLTSGKIEQVCLGDSVTTPGASYADDASVIIHELQHGITMNNYSPHHRLNQFWYDEAGALNEALSDFMSLVFAEQQSVPAGHSLVNWDWRVFSRWALSSFDPEANHSRGAHRCPRYDRHFPQCDHFPEIQLNSMSYVYPDGLGWPYAFGVEKSVNLAKVFRTYKHQEEIHGNSVLLLGALWDIYTALKKNHPTDLTRVNQHVVQLVMESVRRLPPPNFTQARSPVTFIRFAEEILASAEKIKEWTEEDRTAIREVLIARGLAQVEKLDPDTWAQVGSGTNFRITENVNGGVYALSEPETLKTWLLRIYADPALVTQKMGGTNQKLEPGTVAALWFDVQNNALPSAGGVVLTVSSQDPDLTLLDASVNVGYMPLSRNPKTQVMYGKINGKRIVSTLKRALRVNEFPLGNTYFQTNPYFNDRWNTAVWVKVSPQASPGKTVYLKVEVQPANGVISEDGGSVVASKIDFPLTLASEK